MKLVQAGQLIFITVDARISVSGLILRGGDPDPPDPPPGSATDMVAGHVNLSLKGTSALEAS